MLMARSRPTTRACSPRCAPLSRAFAWGRTSDASRGSRTPTTSAETDLPRWDLTPAFPSLESAEFRDAFARFSTDIRDLAATFDTRGVRRRESSPIDTEIVRLYEEVTDRLNTLLQANYTLGA